MWTIENDWPIRKHPDPILTVGTVEFDAKANETKIRKYLIEKEKYYSKITHIKNCALTNDKGQRLAKTLELKPRLNNRLPGFGLIFYDLFKFARYLAGVVSVG